MLLKRQKPGADSMNPFGKEFTRKTRTGTDVMIFKIFLPKNSAKKMAFLTQNKAKLCKKKLS
jgi:hypothetical protein